MIQFTTTLRKSNAGVTAAVFKWVKRAVLAVLLLVFAALVLFAILTAARERQTVTQAAPASGHFVSAGDLRMYVQEEGPADGLAVVFIHGFGAWSETWKKTTSVLAAKGFHTIALDIPPFGFSEKPLNGAFSTQVQAQRIVHAFDSLHLRRAILVGHSIGGRPTVEVALSAPDRIRALVLVDVALGLGPDGQIENNDPSWLVRSFFAIRPLRNAVLSATATNPLMSRTLLGTFVADPRILNPELLSVYQQPLVVKDSTNRLGDWLRVLSVESNTALSGKISNLARLSMPTSIIWGAADRVTPLWQGETLKRIIPDSSLSVLPGIGHIPQIEDPVPFNNSLLAFLERIRQQHDF